VTLPQPPSMASSTGGAEASSAPATEATEVDFPQEPKAKKSRTNTPWTPAEELRLKQMRDASNSWSEIAKVSTFFWRLRAACGESFDGMIKSGGRTRLKQKRWL
jgi:hypothetical protein